MKKRIWRKKRNGTGSYFNLDFSWKPEVLQEIYGEFEYNPFTISEFMQRCCGYASESEIPKFTRRLSLLKKNGWLASKKKTIIEGRKKFRIYKIGKKGQNYLREWGHFTNEEAPLYTKRWFNKPKIIEVEKEVPVVEERYTSREIKPVEEV